MGYQTDFSGEFDITPTMKPEHAAYINKFSITRRMKRNSEIAETMPDPERIAVGLPIGPEAAYFLGGGGNFFGDPDDSSIVAHNDPPEGQPGLWCQWIVTNNGKHLEWDGNEKFYHYVDWLKYLIEHFFKLWGYVLNGEVFWSGDEHDDRGTIYVKDNAVEDVYDTIKNDGPSWSH